MKDAPDVETRAEEIRRGLEGLAGQIDGLIEAHVYRGQGSNGYTLLLDSLLRDKAALAFYQDHPLHVAQKQVIGAYTSERFAFDYAVED